MSAYTKHSGWFEPASGINFRTTAPVIWEVGAKGSGLAVTVPPGFVFDVSVPSALRWLFNPAERRFLKAAALHDWLLREEWTRISAAAVFHDALAADGVSRCQRLVMWLAVSLWRFR